MVPTIKGTLKKAKKSAKKKPTTKKTAKKWGPGREADDKEVRVKQLEMQEQVYDELIKEAKDNYEDAKKNAKKVQKIIGLQRRNAKAVTRLTKSSKAKKILTKKKTNPRKVMPGDHVTKTTKSKLKTKPRAEVIPKLEIEKPNPRKLPVPMPPGLSKKPKTKTTKKKTTTKKK